ncbi:hypothetical protein EVAR_10752_1 [Eumeta japonica]|uniref:Uncharacterized protein n=1 Tax=Eumeta variegata TaxID=151549 RepID=A0A4C1W9G8_EUMVA|nr:hypothetical protein EVAR_10752_1 [Eumeta japonica]
MDVRVRRPPPGCTGYLGSRATFGCRRLMIAPLEDIGGRLISSRGDPMAESGRPQQCNLCMHMSCACLGIVRNRASQQTAPSRRPDNWPQIKVSQAVATITGYHELSGFIEGCVFPAPAAAISAAPWARHASAQGNATIYLAIDTDSSFNEMRMCVLFAGRSSPIFPFPKTPYNGKSEEMEERGTYSYV